MLALSKADWTAIEREHCKRSLSDFVRRAWHVLDPGQPYVHGWHIEAICDHLEAVTRGDITRLLINVPPGAMKSTLVSVFWPAWEWGPKNMPHLRIVGASHEQGLAIRDALKMRRLISSDWYQILWPIELTDDQNQKMYYENSATGFRHACPVTSLTGRRGDRLIWDDPHSVEDGHSPVKLKTATRVFRETLPTRLNNPDRSAIIIVMQRLHNIDVAGVILSEGFEYTHLRLPMEFEPEHRCTTDIGFSDPRTEENELLFPGRFPRAVVDRDKRLLGSYATAGQFQQRPAPKGGGIFRDEWWRYYKSLPKLQWRSIYADTAQKVKTQHDWSVFQCWGRSYDGQAVLVDQIRGKWEAPELLVQARAFWNKHNDAPAELGALRALKIEDKASGIGLIQTLRREGIPVIEIPRDKDKITRAADASPLIESGNVLLPQNAPWLLDYTAEFSAFPTGGHDDQIDPTMDAIADILAGGTIDYSKLQ